MEFLDSPQDSRKIPPMGRLYIPISRDLWDCRLGANPLFRVFATAAGVSDMVVRKVLIVALWIYVTGCADPRLLNTPDSNLPKILAEGTCWVGVWVERNGSVVEAQLVKSTGVPKIDAACLRAVRGEDVEADLAITPPSFNPVTIRRYAVVEVHWQQFRRPANPEGKRTNA